VEEIVAVMRTAGSSADGARTDLDAARGAVLAQGIPHLG